MKQYLNWRKRSGEDITSDSPLFVGRSKKYNGKTVEALTKRMMNERVKEAAEKAGIGNNNGKYRRMREYCLREFLTTQLANHGVEDKIINFFTCHKISPVDLVYWSRRVEQLREIYKQREKYLNPVSEAQSRPSIEEIDRKINDGIKGFIQSQEFTEICCEIVQKLLEDNDNNKFIKA